MENFVIFSAILDNKFLSYFSDSAFVLYLILLFSAFSVFLLSIVYKKLRRKFPLKVNCWFCNNNTTVPYESSNNWDCPCCKQYNGFNKDGDYNKIIPEQYNYKLNENTFNILRTSIQSSQNSFQANGFCKLCNINQQLKIQQLALFIPLNENKYYEEVEEYRKKLEKAYQLCFKCEKILQETLEKQKYSSLQNKLNNHRNIFSLQRAKILTKFGGSSVLVLINRNGMLGLKIICRIFATLLFLALIVHFETEYQYMKLVLPGSNSTALEPFLPVLKVFLDCKDKIYCFRKELSFAGLVCSFLVDFKNQLKKNHIILLAWGFLHISLWSTLTGLHVVMSGICFFLSIQMTNTKLIYVCKKSLPKKSGFQPVKRIFPEVHSNLREENKPIKKVFSPLLQKDSLASLNEDSVLFERKKVNDTMQQLKNLKDNEEKRKKARRKENEIESLINEEKEKTEPMTLNSSVIQKSFLSSVETEFSLGTDKACLESNGSFSEVHNTLNSLQLGGKKKKTNKRPNFLFANHNFSEGKNSTSIIKPAKFIKNLNSTSWTESNEGNSRSSTPSSGYSSQKPEKIEHNRYDFPKTMTPISVNSFTRHSPNSYFDYYDGNRGFYNNMNCFSPGFLPFQQFPGSLGHTTIYTCTRPTNFPFTFSPWQGYSAQKFSPTPSRFSDVLDCDNLFQESSKKYAQNQKWIKLTTVFYYFSIFLNFITIMGLVYFTSAGVILLDWKLPEFNFFT